LETVPPPLCHAESTGGATRALPLDAQPAR
jgi:hypothetical protein